MQNNNMAIQGQQQVSTVNATTNNAVVAAEVAKVQAMCVMAYQNPRNLLNVENKITAMCESIYLASLAEYEYTRGGSKITGPTVKLVSAIAQAYGNVTSGWQEVARSKEKSKVIAWAWDVENNFKYDLEFEVPLYREAKGGRTLLTSDRDIYEHIANFAARRRRACMEQVIPRYLVDMALEKCHATLDTKADVKTELKKCVNYLQSYHGVTLEELEEKLGMKYEAFSSVQYTTIRKWTASLKDGIAKKEDIFPSKENKNKSIIDVKKQQQAENASIKSEPDTNPETGEVTQDTQPAPSDEKSWFE